MTVFLAMLLDGYRLLNARKLFWITVVLSSGIMLSFASIGFNETGMTYLFGLMSTESDLIRAGSPMARVIYRGIFSSFVVELWLAWAATLLGLISTTTIFPEFMAGGAVDMVLSKPIGRVRLFLYKYLASLLFVVLQVSVFCVGVFLAMGWRIGDWNWIIFAAIPLVTLFYSYFYSVNVLVGVVTRSSLTALLVSVLFLGSLFSLNVAEGLVNRIRTQVQVQVEDDDQAIALIDARLERTPPDERDHSGRRLQTERETLQSMRDQKAAIVEGIGPWHGGLRTVQAVLPKSTETIALLDVWLKEEGDINMIDLMRGDVMTDAEGNFFARPSQEREVDQRLLAETHSMWYIVGTSLVFEAVVLGLACVVFVRRDY